MADRVLLDACRGFREGKSFRLRAISGGVYERAGESPTIRRFDPGRETVRAIRASDSLLLDSTTLDALPGAELAADELAPFRVTAADFSAWAPFVSWDVPLQLHVRDEHGTRTHAFRMGSTLNGGGPDTEFVVPEAEHIVALHPAPLRALTAYSTAELTDVYSMRGDTATGPGEETVHVCLWDLDGPTPTPFEIGTTDRVGVYGGAFSPDGTRALWFSQESELFLVDANTRKTLETFPFPASLILQQKMRKNAAGGPWYRGLHNRAAMSDRIWATSFGAVIVLHLLSAPEPLDAINLSSAADEATALQFADGGATLYVGTRRGAVLRFDLA